MSNIKCYLRLELNIKNKLIFTVRENYKDIALILFEDTNRPGELIKDFSYLYPNYYSSEEEWDDYRNLIKATVFPLEDKITQNSELGEELSLIAENMIEEKLHANHCLEFIYDKVLVDKFSNRSNDFLGFINYILSIC